jgi:zinc transporter 9
MIRLRAIRISACWQPLKRICWRFPTASVLRGISCRFSSNSPTFDRDVDESSKHSHHQMKESVSIVQLALAGNLVITGAKALVWLQTGSTAMLSEAIHSLVDSGNQALLLIGLRGSSNAADTRHQYGYGKQIYFWSLISALGTFWFGAGITCLQSLRDIMDPSVAVHTLGNHVWIVLGLSFVIDGFVLTKTVGKIMATKPAGVTFLQYVRNLRDPTTAAVLMEDGAACLGVAIAAGGLLATHATGHAIYDGMAGLAVSGLLGFMGLYLVRLNQNFLLGQSVDPETIDGIRKILMARPAIEEVHSVQSQWNGPYSFSYKAEVDFDGVFI